MVIGFNINIGCQEMKRQYFLGNDFTQKINTSKPYNIFSDMCQKPKGTSR